MILRMLASLDVIWLYGNETADVVSFNVGLSFLHSTYVWPFDLITACYPPNYTRYTKKDLGWCSGAAIYMSFLGNGICLLDTIAACFSFVGF